MGLLQAQHLERDLGTGLGSVNVHSLPVTLMLTMENRYFALSLRGSVRDTGTSVPCVVDSSS